MDAESQVADADSPCPSPYSTAPSSPKHTHHSSDVAGAESDSVSDPGDSHSDTSAAGGDDFAFELSGDLDSALLSADELFDGGVIRALKPPAGPSQQLSNLSTRAVSTRRDEDSAVDQPSLRRRLEVPAAVSSCRRDTGPAGSGRDRDRDLKWWWLGSSSCSLCSFRSCRKWRLKYLLSFRSSGAGEAKGGNFRFRSPSGNGDSVLDQRFEKDAQGSEVLQPCKVGLWGCIKFNHCEAHGFVKGLETVSSG